MEQITNIAEALNLILGRPLAAKGDVVPDALMDVVERELCYNVQRAYAQRDCGVAAENEDDNASGNRAQQPVTHSLGYASGCRIHSLNSITSFPIENRSIAFI
jgi:hypothetical protein